MKVGIFRVIIGYIVHWYYPKQEAKPHSMYLTTQRDKSVHIDFLGGPPPTLWGGLPVRDFKKNALFSVLQEKIIGKKRVFSEEKTASITILLINWCSVSASIWTFLWCFFLIFMPHIACANDQKKLKEVFLKLFKK